jgi:hypothetical protein
LCWEGEKKNDCCEEGFHVFRFAELLCNGNLSWL